MKNFIKLSLAALMGITIASSGVILANTKETTVEPANASVATYYQGISDDLTGDALITALHNLNTSKKTRSVGYAGFRQFAAKCDKEAGGTKIVGFYDNQLLGPAWDSGSTWNREHVWPKSRNGSAVEDDAHMVRAASTKTNGDRGNKFFATGVYDPGEFVANYRGIAARIIFYCCIADTSLHLVDLNDDSQSNGTMGKLSDLLKWNLEYLPSTASDAALELRVEQNRNNVIEQDSSGQGNRNPFIDHPEYACKIWGNTNSETKKICGVSTTAPTSITVSASKTNIAAGASVQATATANTGASNSVTWSSNNNSVATVDSSGVITAVSAGTATITATSTLNTSVKGTITITVYNASVTGISVSGQKTSFKVGDTFSFGGTVTAQFDDETTANVTSSTTFSGYNMSTAGTQTVTASYVNGGHTYTTTYQITVNEVIPSSDYVKYSGAITEGSYIICSDNTAMKATVSSNRLGYQTVSPSNNKISDPSDDIIWEVSKNGDYYELYNNSVSKYAASNGTANKAVLDSSSSNKTKWTVSGSSTYEFVNLNNSSSSINANLRLNGTYGFACYGTNTGKALTLYKADTSVATVNVTGVNIDKSSVTLDVGDTANVVATVVPSDATNKAVTWTSANEDVATVENGTITAVGAGTTTVTVRTVDGNFSKTVNVTVNAVEVNLVSIDVSSAAKTEYVVGDEFVVPNILAYYSDDTWDVVTTGVTFSGYNMSVAGTQTVTVTYEGKTTTYTITVSEPTVTELTLENVVSEYEVGDDFVMPTVIASYSNGTSANVTNYATVSGNDLTTAGAKTVTVTFEGVSETYSIVVTSTSTQNYDYSINFKTQTETQITNLVSYIDSGSEYVSSASIDSGKVYANPDGLRIGVSGSTATFTINLSSSGQVNATGITVYAKRYGSDTGNLTVTTNLTNIAEFPMTSTMSGIDVPLNGTLTSFTISTTLKRAIIAGITVHSSSSITKVDVTGITLNESAKTLTAGQTFSLIPTITPEDATNKNIIWTSSDEDVATVDSNGVVTALTAGSSTITATTADGGFKATCAFTVNGAAAEHGKVASDPLTVEEAIAKINANNTEFWYVKGIYSSTATAWSSQYGNISIWLESISNSTTKFQLYRATTTDGNAPALEVGDTVIAHGTLKKYNSTFEMDQGGIIDEIITVEEKAIAFAESFNDAHVCGTNNNTPAIQSAWNDVATVFTSLDSYTKAYLSEVDVATETNAAIKEAIERYDMAVSKRAELNDYLGRRPSSNSNAITTTTSTIVMVACIGLVSLVGLGYFYYRKRKEN